MGSLNISHLNFHMSPRAADYMDIFSGMRNKSDNFVLSLNEPPHTGSKIKVLKTFKLFYIEHFNVRAAVGLRGPGIDGLFLRHLSNENRVIVEVKPKGLTNFYFISFYSNPMGNIEKDLEELGTCIDCLDPFKPLILASDTNCRHPDWGDLKAQDLRRGNSLKEFLLDHNLTIRNNFQLPTFQANLYSKETLAKRRANPILNQADQVQLYRTSIVDMIITNEHGSLVNSKCIRLDSETFSDHKHLMLTDFNFGINLFDGIPPLINHTRYQTKGVDWKSFTDSAPGFLDVLNGCDFNQINTRADADEAVNCINSFVKHVCEHNLKRQIHRAGNSNAYLKLPQVKSKLGKIEHYAKLWHQNRGVNSENAEHYKSLYKKELSDYTKFRYNQLNENFKEFCNSDSVLRSYRVHKGCKPKESCTITAFPDKFGNYANSIESNFNNILETYLPDNGHEKIEDQFDTLISRLPTDELCIHPEKVDAIMMGMRPHKAPGEDGISPIILQSLYPMLRDYIIKLFNALTNLKYFPKFWKKGTVVLIPKGNSGITTAKNFRPITLLPVLGKIFEAILTAALNDHLYRNRLMSDRQFGFLRQSSTLDALFDFKGFITDAFGTSKFVLAISLDISGAFDNAAYHLILQRMIERGCSRNIVEMFKSYFQDRKIQINFADLFKIIDQNQGAPQGSNSGPFLWNLILDDLLKRFYEFEWAHQAHLMAYADDTTLYLSFAKAETTTAFETANFMLDFIQNWGKDNSLDFNASKTQAIVFSNLPDSKLPIFPVITMNGTSIPLKKELLLLGMVFDNRLKFKAHIKRVTERAMKEINHLSIHIRNMWGSTPEVTHQLINSIIYPKVTYAAFIWADALQFKYNLEPLRKVSYLSSKKTSRSYKTISKGNAQLWSSTLPLELVVIKYALIDLAKRGSFIPDYIQTGLGVGFTKSLAKTISEQTMLATVNHKRRFIQYIPEIDRLLTQSEFHAPSFSPRVHWTFLSALETARLNVIDLPINRNPDTNGINLNHNHYDLIFWTDGSQLENQSGTGFGYCVQQNQIFIEQEDTFYPLHNKCSVFQAEKLAICAALARAANHFSHREEINNILIATDSLSSIKAIENPWDDCPIIFGMKRYLTILQTRNVQVHIRWVKAHAGVPGNERADSLAKSGAQIDLSTANREHFNFVPISFLKRFLEEKLWEKHVEHTFNDEKPYGGSKLNEWSRSMFHETVNETTVGLLKKVVKITNFYSTQILTRHGSFADYLHKFRLTQSELCPHCQKPDSTRHTLFECESNRRSIQDLEDIGLRANDLRNSIRNICSSDNNMSEFRLICTSIMKNKIAAFRDLNNQTQERLDDLPP